MKNCIGLTEAACSAQMYKERQDFLKDLTGLLVPTEPYELVFIAVTGGVGLVAKNSKKLIAVFMNLRDIKEAQEVADFKFKKRATDGVSKTDKEKPKPIAKNN